MKKIRVAILGSTGSIGLSALEIIRTHLENFEVVALTSGGNSESSRHIFGKQTAEFLGYETSEFAKLAALDGVDAVTKLADTAYTGADVVLNAIAGNAGLRASLTALISCIQTGSKLALANKESCVVAGSLMKQIVRSAGESERAENELPEVDTRFNGAAGLLNYINPVDSEHSAIWQCLNGARKTPTDVSKLVLTASGGPFRGMTRDQLAHVTPTDALQHPNWDMGKLVSTNSATLMNKGLELIEAAYLFDMSPDDIEVVVHPTSEIHSFVQFADGSTLAQASPPTMKIPIAYALGKEPCTNMRLQNIARPIDFTSPFAWQFEPVDTSVFSAINIARTAYKAGPLHLAVMNTVNESMVSKFLDGKCPFTGIVYEVERALQNFEPLKFSSTPSTPTLEEIEKVIASAN